MLTDKNEPNLTSARLRELLIYDPLTGVFTYRISRRGGVRAGAVAGCPNAKGYIVIKIDMVLYYAHRLAWLYVHGVWPPDQIDHKDTVCHHNWIANLRLATGFQNYANRRRYRNNKSGFKGVYQRHGRWQARIIKDGNHRHIGIFDTPEEAHAAYVAKAEDLFGEYANAG